MKYLPLIIWIMVVSLAAAAGTENSEMMNETMEKTMNLPSHLIETEYLRENLDADNLVILDTGRGGSAYRTDHIVHARFAPKENYWTEVNGISGMFPGVDSAVQWLEGLGLSNHSAVVIYDAGNSLWASRLAWTLSYLGHENWAVLDGGYEVWRQEGGPLTDQDTPFVRGNFKPDIQNELIVNAEEVLSSIDREGVSIIDSRSPAEFEGKDVRAARGGHIPSAINIEWTLNNANNSPLFLSGEELAEFYDAQGITSDQKVISYCQTSVRATHTWLALKVAGYDDVAIYDGAWAEWGNASSLPIVQTEE